MFTSFYIEECKISRTCTYHYKSTLVAKFDTSDFELFFDVNCADYFKRLLRLSAHSYLVVKTTTYKNLYFGFRMLSCNQMSHFSTMLSENFHSCTVGCVVECHISPSISNYHSFSQRVKIEGWYFKGSDIHVDFLNIAVESTPNLNLVAWGREKTESLLYVSATNDSVLISCGWVVIFVIIIKPNRFTCKD